jgi:hypothetical protein
LARLKDLKQQLATAENRRLYSYRDRPIDFVDEILHEEPWQVQREIMSELWDRGRVVVPSCFASGKALALDTPIATSDGWSTMGALSVGDWIYDELGQPCRVAAKSPVWDLPSFRVEFDDGSSLVVSGEHEWTALAWNTRHSLTQGSSGGISDWREHWDSARTVSTHDIADDGLWREFTTTRQAKWCIPLARPVLGTTADLPIPPYTLGVWLGDGTTSRAEITMGIVDAVEVATYIEREGIGTTVSGIRGREHIARLSVRGVKTHLRSLGMLGGIKHIPVAYMRASVAQRLALLQGLMDTDGTVSKSAASIDLCDKQLSYDVAELVRSLGWKISIRERPATMDGRVVGTRWRMTFTPDMPVFKMERKASAQNSRTGRSSLHTITSITEIPSVPTQCISVDSPRHLFLAGESLIPTHNSWTAARVVMAWVATAPDAIAITTATTWNQVETILWGEIRKGWQPSLPGRLLPRAPEWVISPSNWARGLSVVDPTNLQGYHEGRVLVVVDEAAGVEAPIYEAINGLLAGGDSACLLIGNPIESSGPFYEAASNPRWKCIPISAFDTPNLQAPDGEVPYPKLVTKQWVEERRDEWGEDDPRWISKVLGQFPDVGTRIIVPLAWFDRIKREPIEFDKTDRPQMGLDIARFGNDDSAMCIRRGPQIIHLERMHGASGPEVGGWAANRAREYGVTRIWGDSGGLGGPVLDFMRTAGLSVVDVNAGSKTNHPEDFVMLRDELWWSLRDRFRDQSLTINPDCIDREVAILRSQMSALFYDYDMRGRIKVESKEQAKKRGVTSPDLADAACLAFYNGGGGWQARAWLESQSIMCPKGCPTPNPLTATHCATCQAELDVPSDTAETAPEAFSLTSGVSAPNAANQHSGVDPNQAVLDAIKTYGPNQQFDPFSRQGWRR